MRLLAADTIRDGGSLVAFFSNGPDLFALFLKIDETAGGGYRDLLVSENVRPEHGEVVRRGSEQEIEAFTVLDRWLAQPIFAPDWGLSDDRHPNVIDLVRRLRNGADTRGNGD